MLFGTCTHCGHSTPLKLSGRPPPKSFLSSEEEIASILTETKRLDSFLLQIHEYRAQQLQRLNTLRSTIGIFPPEVLSVVFQHYIPQPKFDSFEPTHGNLHPLSQVVEDEVILRPHPYSQVTVLGVVCRQWRNVAYSTPPLWQAVEIKVGRKFIVDKAHLIGLYLANVRDTSLSLKLEPTSDFQSLPLLPPLASDTLSEVELLPIFRVIWERADKIKWLTSTLDLGSWVALLSHRFAKLEGLALYASLRPRAVAQCAGPRVTPWSSIPRLKHLILGGVIFHVPQSNPPLPSITILNLDQRDLNICVRLLLLCPNLVEYRVRPSTEVELSPDISPLDHLVTFNYMEVFQVDCVLQSPFLNTLRYLRLPSLKELGLGTTVRNPARGLERLLVFLRRLPYSWSTLNLNLSLSDSETAMNEILSAIPDQVVNLSVIYPHPTNLMNILVRLTKKHPVRGVLMPSLRHLYLKYSRNSLANYMRGIISYPPSSSLPNSVWELVLARKDEINSDLFLLEMDDDHGADWKCLEHELRGAIERGLRFRFLVGGKLVNCLREIYNELGRSA